VLEVAEHDLMLQIGLLEGDGDDFAHFEQLLLVDFPVDILHQQIE